MFGRRGCIRGSDFPTQKFFDWEKNEVTVQEERLIKRYGQCIFVSAAFAQTKKAKLSVLMLEGERGRVALVQFAKLWFYSNRRLGKRMKGGI